MCLILEDHLVVYYDSPCHQIIYNMANGCTSLWYDLGHNMVLGRNVACHIPITPICNIAEISQLLQSNTARNRSNNAIFMRPHYLNLVLYYVVFEQMHRLGITAIRSVTCGILWENKHWNLYIIQVIWWEAKLANMSLACNSKWWAMVCN